MKANPERITDSSPSFSRAISDWLDRQLFGSVDRLDLVPVLLTLTNGLFDCDRVSRAQPHWLCGSTANSEFDVPDAAGVCLFFFDIERIRRGVIEWGAVVNPQ